ncbi:diaminopimelate decarboxylase [Streptomyces sp. NPDC058691]|uniref:diaminopimelate decarboxylase n=1 Tax=Streptomyces sp. NPDC058691 TaxID=3346601 RepID=UPI00365CFD31
MSSAHAAPPAPRPAPDAGTVSPAREGAADGLAPAAGPEEAPEVWPLTARAVGGELHVGGVSLPALAEACGTPLYVVDEADFRERARQWRAAGADRVHYASKAFLCAEMVRWVDAEGLHLDVCSGGELELAVATGFDPARIVLHGNNKLPAELAAAVRHGVGVVVVDCLEEIERLSAQARAAGRVQDVYLRIAPGVAAETHDYMATGSDDVKFGFPISGGHAEQAALTVHRTPGLRFVGVHSHIGSQIVDTSGLRTAAARIAAFVRMLAERHGITITEIDLGGGAGIPYLPGRPRLRPADAVAALRAGIAEVLDPREVRLAVEPGRSMIGTAGVTLYRVGVVKDGLRRRFVSVDGGMSDALRPSLYAAQYTAWTANRSLTGPPRHSVVVGKHCESGDVVVPDIALPEDVAVGDLLAVPATGAYHHVMASNYNFQPRPAVVAVADGRARLMVRRETPADLLARDAAGQAVDLEGSPR